MNACADYSGTKAMQAKLKKCLLIGSTLSKRHKYFVSPCPCCWLNCQMKQVKQWMAPSPLM